jgi:hypothetical protein
MVRWSIMVGSQSVTDELPNSGGVGLGHLLRAVKRCWRLEYRVGGQREHLKEVAIKGDEVLLEERITGDKVVIERELQQGTDLIEALGGQAVAVGHQDQQDVQQPLMVREAGPKAIAYEAMLKESKAAGDLADPLGA